MSQLIHFHKYQGTGNDFIIIDQWENQYGLSEREIAFMCDRRMGIGADGLMFLRRADGADFTMVYYNSDGNESTMCGNGGRCISSYYFSKSGATTARFIAIDGIHESKLLSNAEISLHMSDVIAVQNTEKGYFLDTGSPHLVVPDNDVKERNVIADGASIRYSDAYKKEGVNVNFLQLNEDSIRVRTYERGVESETLSCGTGVTASAIIAGELSSRFSGKSGIPIHTLGGDLKVHYIKSGTVYKDIWLTGPAKHVFTGKIKIPYH